MPKPVTALLPSPALFDVTTVTTTGIEDSLERLPLDRLELAENPRKTISPTASSASPAC